MLMYSPVFKFDFYRDERNRNFAIMKRSLPSECDVDTSQGNAKRHKPTSPKEKVFFESGGNLLSAIAAYVTPREYIQLSKTSRKVKSLLDEEVRSAKFWSVYDQRLSKTVRLALNLTAIQGLFASHHETSQARWRELSDILLLSTPLHRLRISVENMTADATDGDVNLFPLWIHICRRLQFGSLLNGRAFLWNSLARLPCLDTCPTCGFMVLVAALDLTVVMAQKNLVPPGL
jgi:hypothetical protein